MNIAIYIVAYFYAVFFLFFNIDELFASSMPAHVKNRSFSRSYCLSKSSLYLKYRKKDQKVTTYPTSVANKYCRYTYNPSAKKIEFSLMLTESDGIVCANNDYGPISMLAKQNDKTMSIKDTKSSQHLLLCYQSTIENIIKAHSEDDTSDTEKNIFNALNKLSDNGLDFVFQSQGKLSEQIKVAESIKHNVLIHLYNMQAQDILCIISFFYKMFQSFSRYDRLNKISNYFRNYSRDDILNRAQERIRRREIDFRRDLTDKKISDKARKKIKETISQPLGYEEVIDENIVWNNYLLLLITRYKKKKKVFSLYTAGKSGQLEISKIGLLLHMSSSEVEKELDRLSGKSITKEKKVMEAYRESCTNFKKYINKLATKLSVINQDDLIRKINDLCGYVDVHLSVFFENVESEDMVADYWVINQLNICVLSPLINHTNMTCIQDLTTLITNFQNTYPFGISDNGIPIPPKDAYNPTCDPCCVADRMKDVENYIKNRQENNMQG